MQKNKLCIVKQEVEGLWRHLVKQNISFYASSWRIMVQKPGKRRNKKIFLVLVLYSLKCFVLWFNAQTWFGVKWLTGNWTRITFRLLVIVSPCCTHTLTFCKCHMKVFLNVSFKATFCLLNNPVWGKIHLGESGPWAQGTFLTLSINSTIRFSLSCTSYTSHC